VGKSDRLSRGARENCRQSVGEGIQRFGTAKDLSIVGFCGPEQAGGTQVQGKMVELYVFRKNREEEARAGRMDGGEKVKRKEGRS